MMFFNQIDNYLNSFINNCKNTAIYISVFYVYLIVYFTQVLKLILWFRNKLYTLIICSDD